jgi:hypothetical protein
LREHTSSHPPATSTPPSSGFVRQKRATTRRSTQDLETAVQTMKNVPWTALQELKGNPDIIKTIEEAQTLLQSLKNNLTD